MDITGMEPKKMDIAGMEPKQTWIKRAWNLNKNGYNGHGTLTKMDITSMEPKQKWI